MLKYFFQNSEWNIFQHKDFFNVKKANKNTGHSYDNIYFRKKKHVLLLTHNFYIHIKNSSLYLSHSLQTILSKYRAKALLEQMSSLLNKPHNLGILFFCLFVF